MATTDTARAQTATEETERVARSYFDALAAGDRNAPRDWYAEDGVMAPTGQPERSKPEAIAYFEQLWAAIPDFKFEVVEVIAGEGRASVEWHITGTFAGPSSFQGFEPTGAPIDIRGVDIATVRDGKIARIDVYTDEMVIAQQLGVMPPPDAPVQQRVVQATNAKTRFGRKLGGWTGPDEVADGVWRVQGQPGRCSVYFLRDGDGVTQFDAGAKTMLPHVRSAAASLGGLKRVVLGHGHTDHRGTAPYLGVPVFCHPDEVVDAEGEGGWRYWDRSLKFLPPVQRQAHRLFHDKLWDGGPVKIDGTVSEGDDVAGFRVIHIPGHAPGLIALWRESDGVLLCSDAFYTLDMWGRDDEAHVPLEGYNFDTGQARESLRKLAALEPSIVFAGHGEPVRGDVRAQLEKAAAA
jgi:hydroxyacylglutathione hydrolase